MMANPNKLAKNKNTISMVVNTNVVLAGVEVLMKAAVPLYLTATSKMDAKKG